MLLSLQGETYWSRIRRWIVRNFQIFIVSAVKICKQCLHANCFSFWGLCLPDPIPGFRAWTLLEDFRRQTTRAMPPKWKFLVRQWGSVNTVSMIVWCSAILVDDSMSSAKCPAQHGDWTSWQHVASRPRQLWTSWSKNYSCCLFRQFKLNFDCKT